MGVLDLAFPPEECCWQTEAENYFKYGNIGGPTNPVPWNIPFGYITPEMAAAAYSLA